MNIYVSGLSYRINDNDLRQLFEEYGEIKSAKVITDRETGRSRGFGFVEMANDDEAKTAIEELTGAEYDGKALPSYSAPVSSSIAVLASSSLAISTKPKPLERPVSLSVITLADLISPYSSKSCLRSLSLIL